MCIAVLFAGCQSLEKAEPFYAETGENVEFKTEYKYYYSDELTFFCKWNNETEGNIYFHDTFELHQLGENGEWYRIGTPEDVTFNTSYSHFVEPGFESKAIYDLSLFTRNLDEGKTYRISSYYFDDNENYYQIYAEFTCSNKLAEEEMLEITNGAFSERDNNFEVKEFEIYG